MNTQAHIDETTGEQLASVHRDPTSNERRGPAQPRGPGAAQGVRLQRRHPPPPSAFAPASCETQFVEYFQ